MQNLNDHIQNLTIETDDDGNILLEQDTGGNIARVTLHPTHLRYLAEKMGLVETSDPAAQKTIAMLTRRLLVLRERIDHLDDWLTNCSDTKHANLDYEQHFAGATADIAYEFCADLDGVALDANTTKSGGVEEPQKRGCLKSTTPPQASLI